mmetsp:Transcript_17996/g.30117  ORF Transcript_17996/g.30117 Transcript_17996/m.30117 type:complete len:157 (-) Transcript_17996:272-742(-)
MLMCLFAYVIMLCHLLPLSAEVDNHIEFRPLTQEVVNSFPFFSWTEKVPYLFNEDEWEELHSEFQHIGGDQQLLSFEIFTEHFMEFSDPRRINDFWRGCDSNSDRFVDMMEYAKCRGEFDQNGDPYDVSEYDVREANLLASFVPTFMYDEDGIIID